MHDADGEMNEARQIFAAPDICGCQAPGNAEGGVPGEMNSTEKSVKHGERAGLRMPGNRTHQVYVALVLEFARDQRAHLRVLLHRVERWAGGQPELEIRPARLAKRCVRDLVVEDVIL